MLSFHREQDGQGASQHSGPGRKAGCRPSPGTRIEIRDTQRRLIDAGYAESLVRRFPPSQVILLGEKREFEVQRDERIKLLSLPLWQIDSLAGGVEGERSGDGLFADLLPHIIKLCRAQRSAGAADRPAAARRGAAPLRRGARRQAAREAVRHPRALARRPVHRQAVRLHGGGDHRPPPRRIAFGRGERAARRRSITR